jgi:nucleoside-diphosphate-sugar epimerase
MKTVLVTGGTGYAGRFIVEALLAAGYAVTVMGRTKPEGGYFSKPVAWIGGGLEPAAPELFEGIDAMVHAAFHHAPGKYRGGEGGDPETFRRLNLDGTIALFSAAKKAGVGRGVFLSSRAVYGTQPAGSVLTEDTEPHPDTLYGEVKLAAERALAALADDGFLPVSLRATGIYGPAGPGRKHKWADLFADHQAGKPVAPRAGTEVHGKDLATAVRLVLEAGPAAIRAASPGLVFNVSDILLDRHDLLAEYSELSGSRVPLPEKADAAGFNEMDCARLRTLGWTPRGRLDLGGLV